MGFVELLEKYGDMEKLEDLFFYEIVYLTMGMQMGIVHGLSEDDIFVNMKRRSEFIARLKETGMIPDQKLFAVDIYACDMERFFEDDAKYQAYRAGLKEE